MEREIRYCTTEDGVRIAYCVEGKGPPLLVCPQFVESFSLDHLYPPLERFMRRLGEGRALIRYDPRGTGLSQREVTDIPFFGRVEDLRAVLEAAAIGPASVWAPTGAGPPAIAFAANHPEMIAALILYATFPWVGAVFPSDALMGLAALARSNWPMAARALADVGSAREEAGDELVPLADIYVQSATGEVVALAMEGSVDADITPQLTSVSVRTLIVHRINDSFCPVAVGQKLASAIPGARLVTPPGTMHGFDLGDSEAVLKAVASFLDEDPTTRAVPTEVVRIDSDIAFRTILFTDIVGHTEMMQRLGDERGRDVLREHERITREALKAHGGSEVKTMGDGFMASFGSVTKAVECAVALQRAFADHTEIADEPLHVRVGLNAGEPIEEDGDLFGATVILAARIAAKAEGGEILVADTVRGLCSGKGFLFSDRGEFVAKGFEDLVRVYEVRWRE
jgi:class 3 adenylate cyclase